MKFFLILLICAVVAAEVEWDHTGRYRLVDKEPLSVSYRFLSPVSYRVRIPSYRVAYPIPYYEPYYNYRLL
jgi:hypothetical protein